MDKEECVKALEKHANIMPAVTSTGNTSASVYSFALLPSALSYARAHCISESVHACFIARYLSCIGYLRVHARKQRCSGG
jgi:hypothetical protein